LGRETPAIAEVAAALCPAAWAARGAETAAAVATNVRAVPPNEAAAAAAIIPALVTVTHLLFL
jgi:hypothetical protein